jgi:hypothetical protein
MRTGRLFRYVWRINAILIFFASAGIGLFAATLMFSELGCNARRRRAIEAAPPVVADTKENLYLGPMRVVEGEEVLRGELLAPRDGLAIGSGGYSADTRNVLYLDARSTEARWLLPDSSGVISEDEIVWAESEGTKRRHQVAGLVLVKRAGHDLQVAEGTLLIFDATGRHVTKIADGVRALNHASLLDHENILVVYESSRRYVRAIINAQSLEVRSTHEVSVPELR